MARGERLLHDIFGRSLMKFVCNFIVMAVLLLVCQPASAEKRVALVIGNSNYRSVPALPNPGNDAAALAAALKGAGFDVVDSKLDLPVAGMRRALRDFADLARDSDVAVIYYAGHGIEMQGTNYLIPTDARLERDTDAPDELMPLDRVLSAVEPAKALRLVIVDACRNNPFADTMQRRDNTRGVGRGLGRVEPTTTNTLVAFAAKAGSTVLDGRSGNSPYATALVKYIAKPGLDVRRAFGFVRDDVMEATGNLQEPYVYGSLGGAEVALVPAKAVASVPADAPRTLDIRRDLELAMQIDTKEALDAFLTQHPDGYYANLARLELAKVLERARAATTEQAGPAEPVRARAAEPEQRQVPTIAFAEHSPTEHIASGADMVKDEPSAQPERKQEPTLASVNSVAPQLDLTETVQSELRRVGCLTSGGDGAPEKTLQRSLALFNKHASTHLEVTHATTDALETIKLKPARVCPLVCEHGSRVDGDKCSKIVCAEGTFLNSDNECEKRRGKTNRVRRADISRPKREARDPKATEITLPQGLGKIVCNSSECRSTKNGWTYRFQNNLQ
jgi:hypothetical protein